MNTVKWSFLLLAFPVPVALLGVGWITGIKMVFHGAFGIQLVGLFLERWLFLAQSRHSQNLYYQQIA
ncbi:MAG: hypothetical protein HQL54_03400 [Magnetococcales bacterium]|nr:hypothetical protein [Magnetococcales bacterium]